MWMRDIHRRASEDEGEDVGGRASRRGRVVACCPSREDFRNEMSVEGLIQRRDSSSGTRI